MCFKPVLSEKLQVIPDLLPKGGASFGSPCIELEHSCILFLFSMKLINGRKETEQRDRAQPPQQVLNPKLRKTQVPQRNLNQKKTMVRYFLNVNMITCVSFVAEPSWMKHREKSRRRGTFTPCTFSPKSLVLS